MASSTAGHSSDEISVGLDLGDGRRFETKLEKAARLEKERAQEYDAANPFRKVGLRVENALRTTYNVIQPSGVGFSVCVWWYAYPAWCRYRHANIQRYTKPQIQFRHRWFSVNIPKVVVHREQRAVVVIMACCVAHRWMNNSMTLPDEIPQGAMEALNK